MRKRKLRWIAAALLHLGSHMCVHVCVCVLMYMCSSLYDNAESADHSQASSLTCTLMHVAAFYLVSVRCSGVQMCVCKLCRPSQLCQSFWLPPRLMKWTLFTGTGYCSTTCNTAVCCSDWACTGFVLVNINTRCPNMSQSCVLLLDSCTHNDVYAGLSLLLEH